MHLLSSTGPVTTCTGEPVETAKERGAVATANVMEVDCCPCLRHALVALMQRSDAQAREQDALRADLRLAAQELRGAISDMHGGGA